MLKRVLWPADDCFCTGLMVITSSLSFPAVGGKKWSTCEMNASGDRALSWGLGGVDVA